MTLIDLPTIAFLIIAACNIATLLLFKQMRRDKRHIHIGEIQNNIDIDPVVEWLNQNALTVPLAQEVIARLERIEVAIATEEKKTRKDVQEVKTALRDDEKDDQKT